MDKLVEKLNLKDFDRICIINSGEDIISAIRMARPSVRIDRKTDPRYLYNFFMIFVRSQSEVDELSHSAVHNLYEDGVLWFAYPRSNTGSESSVSREKGWDMLKTLGFKPVRQITVNEEWNGIRFRNSRFVRSRIIAREN